jgi:hypothetical protein
VRTLRARDAFAAGLRARHRRRVGRVPALPAVALVLPRAPAPVWHVHAGGPRLHVAPSIAVTIASPPPSPAPPRAAPALTPALAAPTRREITTRRVHEASMVVERIRSRGVRIEAGAPRPVPPSVAPASLAAPAAPPVALAPSPSPVALVLAARYPATVGPDPRAVVAAGDHADGPALDATRSAPPPATVPTLDVERITDSVIGALDRRLIAHRERFGIR